MDTKPLDKQELLTWLKQGGYSVYNDKVYTESKEIALDDNDNNEEVVLSEILPLTVPICDGFLPAPIDTMGRRQNKMQNLYQLELYPK
ncbi:MAG: hypothetical protein PUP92_30090, partial [Rhizonema sp. PD38]|nr:hypothetical protein [Rhizonema sp. PD38]